jgi:FimV-like protein
MTFVRASCIPPRRTLLVYFPIAFCWVACGGPALAPAQERKTPPPPPQESIDYAKPVREYVTARAGKWTISVEKQLQTDAPAVAKQALERLEKKLPEALKALPEPSHANLKKLQVFLMYGPKAKGGGRDNGLEYFQKNAPENHKQLDSRWKSSVVIYCAENYVRLSEFWALKALVHELAHAHQLEQWPEDQPDILRAWDNATERGLYRGVKDDQGKKLDKAYAAVNQLEYFAELSCMYFVGCNYQPFNRKELKAYDPTGFAMIEKMWGVAPEKAKDPEKPKVEDKPRAKPKDDRPPEGDPDKAEKDAARKLKLARQLIDDGKPDAARDYLEEIIKKHKDTKAAEEARQILDKLNK